MFLRLAQLLLSLLIVFWMEMFVSSLEIYVTRSVNANQTQEKGDVFWSKFKELDCEEYSAKVYYNQEERRNGTKKCICTKSTQEMGIFYAPIPNKGPFCVYASSRGKANKSIWKVFD